MLVNIYFETALQELLFANGLTTDDLARANEIHHLEMFLQEYPKVIHNYNKIAYPDTDCYVIHHIAHYCTITPITCA